MEYQREAMGLRISNRRKALKIKQHQLAEHLNISNNHLSSIERGKESCSLEIFVGICTALQVTPDYLLLGAMHSSNVPQNIVDSLRLCTEEDIAQVQHIVNYLVERNSSMHSKKNFV